VKPWAVGLTLIAALLAAGCTSPDTSVAPKATATPEPIPTGTPRSSETTSPDASEEAESVPLFASRGLLPVGVTTLAVGERMAEVWYPADGNRIAARPVDTFDTLELFPEELAALVPETLTASYETGAYRDIPAAPGGSNPVVVFSHGSPSFRQQSTQLATHLASWGFVVVSVDHLERGLSEYLEGLLDPEAAAAEDGTDAVPGRDEFDIQNALVQLEAANETPGHVLEGAVDLGRLAVSGHSAGANTAWRLAELEGVDTVIAIATSDPVQVSGTIEGIERLSATGVPPGAYTIEIAGIDEEQNVTVALDGATQVLPIDGLLLTPDAGGVIQITADPETLTTGSIEVEVRVGDKPALVISAADDVVTPPERSEAVFALAGLPKRLISIRDAGHDSFSDACLQIYALGGLDAALGDLAGALGDLTVAGENGCTPESVDPAAAQAVAGHFMVAHLFDVFEMVDVTGALDPNIVDLIEGVELDDFQSFEG
jgi:pimeloyl-ACP methyl ester carboxylesterase